MSRAFVEMFFRANSTLFRLKTLVGSFQKFSDAQLSEIIDISKPNVQNYLEHIRINAYSDKNIPNHLRPLASVLQKRSDILESMKVLEEIKLNDKRNEMKESIESEREVYESTLKTIEAEIISLLFPKTFQFGHSDCVIEIIAGVGGLEAMLFAKELMDMYVGYATFRKWNVEILQQGMNENNGLRHASIIVSGPGAFEILSIEAGVHRVQRVPATEKSGRLHTSTASVTVMRRPTDVEINIPDVDIKIERKRSSGAGGQSVNTTDSCVRIFHLPTGLIVESQSERDQHKNKKIAMERLRNILYERQINEQFKKEKDDKKSQMGSGLRNEKIRTYNYNQDRVTDHRLGSSAGTVHDLNGILKGGLPLDNLIDRILQNEFKKKLFREIETFRPKKDL